jgi:REP element-mobilizing transposase RayT
MPRIALTIAAGYPHHIIKRGNNRASVFFDDEDRQFALGLQEWQQAMPDPMRDVFLTESSIGVLIC